MKEEVKEAENKEEGRDRRDAGGSRNGESVQEVEGESGEESGKKTKKRPTRMLIRRLMRRMLNTVKQEEEEAKVFRVSPVQTRSSL